MIQIIPAIDLLSGRCVRLSKGDYSSSRTYSEDPLEIARAFEGAGVKRLHVVDLDGARSSRPENLAVLEKIAASTSLEIEFGGGLKSEEALRSAFSAGAWWAICGSIAVSAPESLHEWAAAFGPERFILGADIAGGKVATHGWLRQSSVGASELVASFPELSQVLCTDISRDGMLQGPDLQIYTSLQEQFPDVTVILSGGVSCAGDLLAADKAGIRAAIVGKAFYEGRITLKEISDLCSQNA